VGALSLAGATLASAASYDIYYSGSSAFRTSTHNAIVRQLATIGTVQADFVGSAGGLAKATYANFHTSNGTDDYTVHTSWNGSEQGLDAVYNGTQVPFLVTSSWSGIASASVGSSGPTGGTPEASLTSTNQTVDAALADSYPDTAGFTASGFNDDQVAVQPFRFVASPSVPSSFTNITGEQVFSLYTKGKLPLSIFTGNSADTAKVLGFGRNQDSGTRAISYVQNGIGYSDTTIQYVPTLTSGVITSIAQSSNPAANGASSGGTLATWIAATGSTTASGNPGHGVAYLGVGDASTALTNGAKALTVCGVAYDPALVKTGTYPFWSYEHSVRSSTNANAALIDAITANITSTDASIAGIKIGDMAVTRQGLSDTGAVTP